MLGGLIFELAFGNFRLLDDRQECSDRERLRFAMERHRYNNTIRWISPNLMTALLARQNKSIATKNFRNFAGAQGFHRSTS